MTAFDAVVLAGGDGVRLGGVDKAGLVVGGRTLLDRVLTATAAAERTVVVGDHRPVVREVLWTREQPPGGGPAPALAAGLGALHRPEAAGTVVVLATDLPGLLSEHVHALVAAVAGADAAVFVDGDGRRQPLAAAYRAEALGRALAELSATASLHGTPVRAVLEVLSVREVKAPPHATDDCDTPEQVDAARRRFEEGG